MKKCLVSVLTMLMFFIMPKTGSATLVQDNFNDNSMDTALWEYLEFGSHTDDVSLNETNNRLELNSTGWTPGPDEDSISIYVSKGWFMSLNDDFDMQIDFYHTNADEEAGVQIGLYHPYDEGATVLGLAAENWVGTGDVYWYGFDKEDTEVLDEDVERTSNSGYLQVSYDASSDIMALYASEYVDPLYEFENFTTAWETDSAGIFFGGWANGAVVNSGESYLDNFSVTGTVVPEPATVLLLTSGLFGVAFFKKRG